MKLDFANHHLKKLRPWIVENAVEFEWRYFKERFEAKLVTVDATSQWLEAALDKYPDKPPANVYNSALIDMLIDGELVCNPANQQLIPETFRMDLSRLSSYHNEFQDLSIMATLLMLFKQVCGKAVVGHLTSVVDATLWTLLNHAETTMAHVATQLAADAGKLRARDMTAAEVAALNRLVDSTLTFDHPLFMLLQKRVTAELAFYLDSSGKLSADDSLARHGLLDIKEELSELGRKIKVLTDHNRSTYRQLYDAIIEDWRITKKAASANAGAPPSAA
ncbi:T-complex 11 [Catenaria anguillulae PL171]|uniref:T-complex 11 n=1 Tax=Catenaria anguillulae PL171 TaxID=765915 RepID=A0A1Y2HPP6_9FUNG|nr:T-complex 11 [Catenaria anguillulae PL171]